MSSVRNYFNRGLFVHECFGEVVQKVSKQYIEHRILFILLIWYF